MFGRLKRLFGGGGRIVAVAAVAAVVALGVGAGQGAASGGVLKVRLGGDAVRTRVVVDLDRSVKGQILGGDPRKVVLSLPGVDASAALQGKGMGLVSAWSVQRAGGAARVNLTLTRAAVVKRRFLLPPGDGVDVYRYVIDLEAKPGAAPLVSAAPAVSKAKAKAPAPARPKSTRRVVVIDPGHGGKDPGASGAHAKEKTITLAAARELKARLERTGRYKVVLTRESDVYIPLETRVALARRADAELFISIHADAGESASLRGASVYTLSEQGSDRAARHVLNGENWVRDVNLPGRDASVNRILLDLTQRATRNRSAAFARVLLERIADRTTLLQRSHRDAGFVVLLAPDVPAVLLEMGFLTNPEDERILNDPRRRARLMDGVGDAIDAYFERENRYASVAGAP